MYYVARRDLRVSLSSTCKVSPHDSCPETWCWQRDEVVLVIFILYNNIPSVHNPYYYNPSTISIL